MTGFYVACAGFLVLALASFGSMIYLTWFVDDEDD